MFEYSIELLNCYTYYSPQISPFCWSLLPKVVSIGSALYGPHCKHTVSVLNLSHAPCIHLPRQMKAYADFLDGATEQILVMLDNYISRGGDVLLTANNGEYINCILGTVKKVYLQSKRVSLHVSCCNTGCL